MRVLFDKNVPDGTRQFLSRHQVETVEDHGWETISNGDLLDAAESAGFEVFVTADQNIVYQQNLKSRTIGLVVLGSNIWPIVRNHAAEIAAAVDAVKRGSYAFIEMPLPPKIGKTEGPT